MEIIKKITKRVFLLSVLVLLFTLPLSILSLGKLIIENNRDDQGLRFLGDPLFIFWDMSGRYFFIAVCFLLFTGLFLIRRQVFFKLLAILPLAVAGLQLIVSMKVKYQNFGDQLWSYSKWAEILFLADFSLFILTITLLAFHIRLIWLIHRSPVYQYT